VVLDSMLKSSFLKRLSTLIVFGIAICAALPALARRRSVAHHPPATFSNQIVRVFQEHCQVCHHPGGIGPFSLTTYESAKANAAMIAFMTSTKKMPPIRGLDGCTEFDKPNRLSPAKIALIQQWVRSGAPEGNRADLPPPLHFNDEWTLGEPDVIVQMPAPYLGSASTDTFRLFPLVPAFDRDVYITGIEVRPGPYAHHAAVWADASGKSDELDAKDAEPGFFNGADLGFEPSAFLATWTPGQQPFRFPPGHAIRIPKGSKVVLDIHLHPHHGQIGPEQTRIGLHLADAPVHKLVEYGSVDNPSFLIPANANDFPVRASWTPGRAIHILGAGTHAHRLLKSFSSTATLPDGSTRCIMKIDDWDWRWQGLLPYAQSLPLPAGTRIDMEGLYDNTESNPFQEFFPPRDIPYGGRADEEMCRVYFTFTWDDVVVDIDPNAP
jgi:hypothetical protein